MCVSCCTEPSLSTQLNVAMAINNETGGWQFRVLKCAFFAVQSMNDSFGPTVSMEFIPYNCSAYCNCGTFRMYCALNLCCTKHGY